MKNEFTFKVLVKGNNFANLFIKPSFRFMRLLSRMTITLIINLICLIAKMTQATIFRLRIVFFPSILP